MSDSSEEEDLSHFKEVVDSSFLNKLKSECEGSRTIAVEKPSERYLQVETHYNDVRVSDELQNKIAAKISKVIENQIKFVKVQPSDLIEPDMQDGIKLFKDSTTFLSCEELPDITTEIHNKESKNYKKRSKKRELEPDGYSEEEKVHLAAVEPDHILSRKETKLWKSRRKEKIEKYKLKKPENILIPIID